MRSSIPKLIGLIALMLVICIPSFGGVVFDNLGAEPANTGGTGFGDIALAQRFFVSGNNAIENMWSYNVLNSGWFTTTGGAFQMKVTLHGSQAEVILPLFNGDGSDPGVPTVSIYEDFFNEDSLFGPQFEPGENLGGLFTALTNLPNLVSCTTFTTSSLELDAGNYYWVVLSSPGPTGALGSLGVDTQWSTAPEPMTLAMVGGALVLLSVRRKRHQK